MQRPRIFGARKARRGPGRKKEGRKIFCKGEGAECLWAPWLHALEESEDAESLNGRGWAAVLHLAKLLATREALIMPATATETRPERTEGEAVAQTPLGCRRRRLKGPGRLGSARFMSPPGPTQQHFFKSHLLKVNLRFLPALCRGPMVTTITSNTFQADFLRKLHQQGMHQTTPPTRRVEEIAFSATLQSYARQPLSFGCCLSEACCRCDVHQGFG